MKNMRKLASLLLALVMIFALATAALATSGGTDGKITVNNALKGETYSIYRIFDLESYNDEAKTYAYTLSEKWAGFAADGYFTVNGDGYVVWNDAADVAAFAAIAMAYATTNSIEADGSAVAGEDPVVFENLPWGYYLVDTTLGSICSLNTTNPAVEIAEKNEEPPVVKTVEEDSTGAYGATNDADVSQIVNYKSAITVKKGTENYVLHDTMSAGLTFDAASVKVSVNGTDVVAAGNWTLTSPGTDGHTFDIAFENSYIAGLDADTDIVVSYSATLNADAVIAGDGNPNTTSLTYGNAQESAYSQTVTKTWGVDLFKYAAGDPAEGSAEPTKDPLANAKFVLYKEVPNTSAEEGAPATVKKYAVVTNGLLTGWADAISEEIKLTTGADGIISIDGLDSDSYWFEETDAPAGYNLLKEPVAFTIANDGAVKMGDMTVTQVEVENKAGSLLPSTGGMGTTIFYILGGVLVLGAAVLLIARKKVGAR